METVPNYLSSDIEVTPAQAAKWLEETCEPEHLLDLARRMAYQLMYLRRCTNRQPLPESAADPLIATLQQEADLELYYSDI
jgi:hypothetical protein